jgi:sugar phosphate isomerase/epimerase
MTLLRWTTVAVLLSLCPLLAAPSSWSRERLQAWCIVPYDAKKRTPEQRAVMLKELGILRYAYDHRPEHVPTFDREIEVMKAQGIEITAWWFPTTLDDTARIILSAIERHGIKPALWVQGGPGGPVHNAAGQRERVREEAERLRPLAVEARRLGCQLGLYNHLGWFGDPDNQLLVLAALEAEGFDNVGLVFNFHHAHDYTRNFAHLWPRLSAHVLAVNLNGMTPNADREGRKILPMGEGTDELALLRVIKASGWQGDVGVLSHLTDADAAETLARNLAGYNRLLAALAEGTDR